MERIGIYPGSFDPITNGHLDIIRRASGLFDRVIVAVLLNPKKIAVFSLEDKLEMLHSCCDSIPNVEIDFFSGLLADYVQKYDKAVILRGLRDSSDWLSESKAAQLNRRLTKGVDTLFLCTDERYASISSSAVREIALFGGSIEGLVPEVIREKVLKAFLPESAQ